MCAFSGYRHWHGDLRSDDTPLESVLGFTCKLGSDVHFQGKQALLQQKAAGLRRKLVAFTLDEYVLRTFTLATTYMYEYVSLDVCRNHIPVHYVADYTLHVESLSCLQSRLSSRLRGDTTR